MKKYSLISLLFLVFTILFVGAYVFVSNGGVTSSSVAPEVNLIREDIMDEEKVLPEIPRVYIMPQREFVGQTFNNCGPASLSMAYSLLGLSVTQSELAEKMRPFNNPAGGVDDKSVFPEEFVKEAEERGFMAVERPNGTEEKLEKLVANNIPVIVRTWLNPIEDIGHFRVVRGYDQDSRVFSVDDSYNGPNLSIGYDEFNSLWKPFNYSYIIIYPKEKAEIVEMIIGRDMDSKIAWENALTRARKEVTGSPTDYYAKYNLVTAYYHLGQYENAIREYEAVAGNLPPRMFWYQLEPIRAYQKTRNYDKVFAMTNSILNNGNLAYSELYQIRGEIYAEQGNNEAARVEYDKAIYYNKNFANILKLD